MIFKLILELSQQVPANGQNNQGGSEQQSDVQSQQIMQMQNC